MERKPFLLKPTGKDYIWGGRRLNDDFDKNIDANVANVFARADKAMYQHKKEMKAVRD